MRTYLVCFDISDDRIRYRVSKALAEYGTRVQRSVFEVAINTSPQLKQLIKHLGQLIEEEIDDDIRFYRLCANCRKVSTNISGERIAHFPSMIIV